MKRIYPDRPLTPSEKSARFYRRHKKKISKKNREYQRKNKKKIEEYLRKNRKKIHARKRLYVHGMTQEEHDTRLKKQKYRCAVCRKKFRETPHIDHNHKTMKNRGLLCADCNLGLGRFKDSVRILLLAIEYLKGTS